MPRKANGNGNHVRRWGRLHRWCGIGAVVFLIVLSISGIALNHADALKLDQRFVGAEWLLDLYGIEAPAPAGSYSTGAHRVTQLGERLYFDQRELTAKVGELTGAVAAGELVAIAAGDRVLLATSEGELIESIKVGTAAIERIGRLERTVVVRVAGRWYRSDEDIVGFSPAAGIAEADVAWATPSPVEPERLEALNRLYRGRGITGERLLADFHSGRLFGRYGPWVMDLAGLAFLFLGFTGLILFIRRRR